MSFHCEPCDRTYKSKEALQQHKRDSPAHDFNCTTCGRRFISDSALQQHLRDAPFHPGSIRCDDCDRTFDTEQSLQQHLRDSPVHAATLDCEACNRTFGSPEALGQHLRDSPVHQQVPETPLDVFFRSFQTFDYDPSLPPATSYARLQRHERWRRSDPASLDAWNRYQDALQSELRMWYGSEDDLTAWHALCRAIGVDPLPQTCEQCERVRPRHARPCSYPTNLLRRLFGGHMSISWI